MELDVQPKQLQYRINGIDFIGDKDNGKKIWDEVRGSPVKSPSKTHLSA
jgi:hypothetical protein